jgi:hypothetical protein
MSSLISLMKSWLTPSSAYKGSPMTGVGVS